MTSLFKKITFLLVQCIILQSSREIASRNNGGWNTTTSITAFVWFFWVGFWGPGPCPLDPGRNFMQNSGIGNSGALTATRFMPRLLFVLVCSFPSLLSFYFYLHLNLSSYLNLASTSSLYAQYFKTSPLGRKSWFILVVSNRFAKCP